MEARELKQVVRKASRGDEKAAAKLFDHYYPRVVRFALAKLGNYAAAEDVAAEAFARVLKGFDRFEWKDGGFEAWLFRVASNLVVDHARLGGRERIEEDVLDRAETADTRTPELAALEHQSARELRVLLDQLVPDQREVLLLRFVAELGPEEIGTIMKRKANAVRQLQFRALANLRSMMSERAEGQV